MVEQFTLKQKHGKEVVIKSEDGAIQHIVAVLDAAVQVGYMEASSNS